MSTAEHAEDAEDDSTAEFAKYAEVLVKKKIKRIIVDLGAARRKRMDTGLRVGI